MIKPLHQGISVPDMEASIAWYQKIFGFEKISDAFVEFLNARIVFLQLGEFQLELFEYRGEDKKPLPEERLHPNEDLKTCGTKHVAYSVEDLPAMVEMLKSEKVEFARDMFEMGNDYVCFIKDNSGVLIELIQVDALK